jgi:hypothetical protein
MQLQPLINRIKEIGDNYGRSPTQVLPLMHLLSEIQSSTVQAAKCMHRIIQFRQLLMTWGGVC